MLARLNEINGIRESEIDHRGELLRLRVDGPVAVQTARGVLADLGYEASETDLAVDPGARWYGASTVRDLSREEARIITDRVLARSGAAQRLDASTRERLKEAVATALFGIFSGHDLGATSRPGTLLGECVEAVRMAAAEIAGVEIAIEIASALERDLT